MEFLREAKSFWLRFLPVTIQCSCELKCKLWVSVMLFCAMIKMINVFPILNFVLFCTFAAEVRVNDSAGLIQAARTAKPGSTILLEPGSYRGGVHIENLHGKLKLPITIKGSDPKNPPLFTGGGSGLQFSKVSHLVIEDLRIERAQNNGLNIDDGGQYTKPSHNLTIRNISISDLPSGNNDAIKLSGIDNFVVENCHLSTWGGSGIDMVGCHKGIIRHSSFLNGGSSGIQCKGGTSEITIQACRFTEFGQRGVNIGGSTGLEFFRPPVSSIPAGSRYEAKDITVEGCTFLKGGSPAAFVGVDSAIFRFNTIINAGRFAFRILQETSTPDFIQSRNGMITDTLIVFNSANWSSGGINIGPNTQPKTFRFARNFWFGQDSPGMSRPSLPTEEQDGNYGVDPALLPDCSVLPTSPAKHVGAHAWKPKEK